jgi:hypothetical protein
MSNGTNYIPYSIANANNFSLEQYVGVKLEGRLAKIRWNSKTRTTEAIFEIEQDGKTLYAVDTVTKDKRIMYLGICHGRRNTIEMAMQRSNMSYQCSLSACFGCIVMFYELRAIIQPYNKEYGGIGIDIVSNYDKPQV